MNFGQLRLDMLKKMMVVTLSLMLTLTMLPLAPQTAAAADGSGSINKVFGDPETLAAPIQQIAVFDSAYGTEDGKDVMYTTVNGDPAKFNVIDLNNKQMLRSFSLPGAVNAWSHIVAPDGTVYIGGGDKLFQYSPVSKELIDLGKALSSESSIWALTVDEQGNVYGGTFPSGKVFQYNPVTGLFKDYGSMVAGQQYVRSIDYKDGIVYAGVGSTGHIIRLNPQTGEKSELPIRDVPGVTELPFVYGLDIRGDYMFAYLSGGGIASLIVYDMVQNEWLDEIYTGYGGLHISPEHQGHVYFVQNKKIMAFDLATAQVTDTGMSYGSGLRSSGWVTEQGDADFPGKSLVTIQYGGLVSYFNPQTGKTKAVPVGVEGQPTQIHALEMGPDGAMYMSGYTAAIASKYDPANGSIMTFPMGQAESIGQLNEKLYFGVYAGGEIREFDTTKPVTAGQNPKNLFKLGENQDRPYVSTTGDGKIFFGSIPDYGHLGGALTVYDPAAGTNSFKVYRNVVQDQSVVGLAYKDGKIYGSTTVRGGLGIDSTATEAKMFIWDVEKEQKIAEFTPNIPGAVKAPIMISGLTFDASGKLWAAADGILFSIDMEEQKVIDSKVIYPNVTDYGMWRPIHIRVGADGLLYTDLYGKITILDPVTLDHKALDISTQLMTLGRDGHIYYAEGAKLKRIKVSDGPVTSPEEPLFGDVNGDNVVDIQDKVLISRHLNKDAKEYKQYDLNKDGKISSADVLIINRILKEQKK
ncbi:dockerin type I domain-containing protein [Paenibacillus dakarensis]|uniref:dockerin type I domain-containing protein n=1 Tax=Paenibacillus dakarensis TaxID=1527293 RepID=UPI0006D5753D|nr:dockerin type I domain-containing protein [Paenibacillus dakarensis]